MSRSRNPPQKGQGAARAKQMGLLLDLSPDAALEDSGGNEEELEAELLALIGGGGAKTPGKKEGGKASIPMMDIERMAALCMKDLDEEGEDDADLENDAELLAELTEVLEESAPPAPILSQRSNTTPKSTPTTPSGAGGLESCLQERIDMYQTAIVNANASGESSKARRYERGLKTLQSMLASVKKGKPINEEEIPPPVSTGAKPTPTQQESFREQERPAPDYTPSPNTNEKPLQEVKPITLTKPQVLQLPNQKTPAVTSNTPAISPLTPVQPNAKHSEVKASMLSRQRDYKLAAIQAKQSGNTDLARQHLVIIKKLDSVVEAIDRGEHVAASSLPPPPGDAAVKSLSLPPQSAPVKPTPAPLPADAPAHEAPLPAPRNLAEALQQRMDKYKSAAESAKSKGDDRKSRMHQRIAKQYQDAIKAHKTGRPVNLAELPVPPDCPPLQGAENAEQNFLGVLETAVKLANQDADAEDDDGPEEEVAKPAVRPAAQKARGPAPSHSSSPAVTPTASTDIPKLAHKAQQQLDFLLRRRQQFVKAALRSKQMKDVQGAAQHLRNAKGLDPMITAAEGGLPVDISKVPSAPVSEEDYTLSHARSSSSSRSSQQYAQLMEHLRLQHEKCLSYLQQFTQIGNLAETLRFEKLAEECMSDIELVKKAHANGYPVPGHHVEERTINTMKIFPNLTASEMELTIIKGINLPTPGFSASDLDASVRFEFPFPSVEEAQRDKTNTVRGTNSPEFRAYFKLHINRTHRAFKRAVQTKGMKLEIIHKGGLFKNDKVVGSAQMKLEALENQCEIREIMDVLDGRKATGGKLDVRVRIREPLSGAQLQSVTEKWIAVDPPAITPDRERPRNRERAPSPKSKPRNHQGKGGHSGLSPPHYKLHSFSLLNYEKERLERKIGDYKKNRRDPPPDILNQHKEICHRLHWQKSYLERGSSSVLAEYDGVLNKFAHGLADSVKKFSSEGNREAAKDALGRLKMVETEMESLRRKCAA